jgi:CHRD domain-containing protein
MQKHALTLATALLGVGMVTACGSSKSTQPSNITYVATLTGANERPNPTNSTGTGSWTGVLNPSTNVMTYTLTYSGLSGNSSGAHIHAQGDATTTANVVLNFANFAGATTAFTTGNQAGSAAGSVNMSGGTVTGFSITGDSLRKAMDAGMAYVNVHSTPNFQGGEIRGQIHRQ